MGDAGGEQPRDASRSSAAVSVSLSKRKLPSRSIANPSLASVRGAPSGALGIISSEPSAARSCRNARAPLSREVRRIGRAAQFRGDLVERTGDVLHRTLQRAARIVETDRRRSARIGPGQRQGQSRRHGRNRIGGSAPGDTVEHEFRIGRGVDQPRRIIARLPCKRREPGIVGIFGCLDDEAVLLPVCALHDQLRARIGLRNIGVEAGVLAVDRPRDVLERRALGDIDGERCAR